MPRIVNNPTQAICPSFESPVWDFVRQSLIDTHQGVRPLTAEEATQRLKDAWTRDNDNKISTWNAQLKQDRPETAIQERLAQEEEARRAQRREREAEEQQREAEKKRPKLNDFDPNRSVSSWIEPRPAEYALDKIDMLEYVELDYFTIDVWPLSTQKTPKNIRNDEDLSWGEMFDAKRRLLHFMVQSGVWPTAHTDSLASFFVALQTHPRRFQTNGQEALLLYQSRVRREWFSALKSNKGFKIEDIGEDFLRSCADLINDQMWEKQLEEMCRTACAAAYEESSAPRPSSRRRRRNRGGKKVSRRATRSTSPVRTGESSRRSYRSRSPLHYR
ncbi:hypothetical protein DFH94DRAFT_6796 [Russula ochroleuca]|uniref:Uncharacterized protein n=1 Tax=Russula ochroleuca TaxID=152965 RepID=A0A9P5N5K6_9AGAM|nr:hypothetical protein DFH94DRAFT_6796 [Russula ochroleuca]